MAEGSKPTDVFLEEVKKCDDEKLPFEVDEKCAVTNISYQMELGNTRIKIGDVIQAVKDKDNPEKPVWCKDELNKVVRTSGKHVNLRIIRGVDNQANEEVQKHEHEMPQHDNERDRRAMNSAKRAKRINELYERAEKEGMICFSVQKVFKRDRNGMTLAGITFDDTNIVTVEEEDETIWSGDQLIAIDGDPTNNRDETQTLLYTGGIDHELFFYRSIKAKRLVHQQETFVIAIGNPGSGKSAILNSLAGKVEFDSGMSYGAGLTAKMKISEESIRGTKFVDTPGVYDDKLRKAAGDAIGQALKQTGPKKILFFIGQDVGRVIPQDVRMMRMVLESIPEIRKNYGIVVNKMSQDFFREDCSVEDAKNKILPFNASMFQGIHSDWQTDSRNIIFLPNVPELENAKVRDKKLIEAYQINPKLPTFVENLPILELPDLKGGRIYKIGPSRLQEYLMEIEEKQNKLEMDIQERDKKLERLEHYYDGRQRENEEKERRLKDHNRRKREELQRELDEQDAKLEVDMKKLDQEKRCEMENFRREVKKANTRL